MTQKKWLSIFSSLGGIKRLDKLFIAKTGDNFLELKINHSRFGNPVGPREFEITVIQRKDRKFNSTKEIFQKFQSWS